MDVQYLQILDLSPHLGHKLIAAADLKFDYAGLIVDPGDSMDGISIMLLGLFEEKKLKTMANPCRIQMVKALPKTNINKRKTTTKTKTTPPKKKQKVQNQPEKTPIAEKTVVGDLTIENEDDDEDESE